jgi:hypothetical protein
VNLIALIELTAAVVGCTTDGPRIVRLGRRFFRRSNRAGSARVPMPTASPNRTELLALLRSTEEFRNNTAHEEYRR